MIIDAQVHVYDSAWPGARQTKDLLEVGGDDMVAAMDSVGVAGAIVVSSWGGHRADTSLAESVYLDHPERFRLVAPIDLFSSGIPDRIQSWAATPGAVGIRLMYRPEHVFSADDINVKAVMKAATASSLPVNVQCWGQLPLMGDLARRYTDVQLIIDHVGLTQPLVPPAPPDCFEDIPSVVALAGYPNVAVKITGACTYSRKEFPYQDLWEPIGRVVEAFGIDRCMWGTDWTRAFRVVNYPDSVSAFRDHWPLDKSELSALMGGSCMRIYRW